MNRTGIILQARLGSNRFPKKVLKQFSDGETILNLVVKSIQSSNSGIPLVIATSDNKLDDAIEEFCRIKSVTCFRGDELNVTKRFFDCATLYNFKFVVRVCADNPFFNAGTIRELIKFNTDYGPVDYLGFRINSIPAIKTHFGFWAELFSTEVLLKQLESTKDINILEHVTKCFYENPEFFKVNWLDINSDSYKNDTYRFTVDTLEDFNLIDDIRLKFKDQNLQNPSDLIEIVSSEKDILSIMKRNILANAK